MDGESVTQNALLGRGLIGASTVARSFMVHAINAQPNSRVVAIAGSDPDRGRAFAREYGIPTARADIS